MANKYNARGSYWCMGCGLPVIKAGKRRPRCAVDPFHAIAYFSSQKELKRWNILKLRERLGEIRNLTPHPTFKLIVKGKLIGKYTADTAYIEGEQSVVEEVKGDRGVVSRDWPLRVKLAEAIYGIQVRVV